MGRGGLQRGQDRTQKVWTLPSRSWPFSRIKSSTGSSGFLNSSPNLMLKLKLQYFGHLMQRTDSLEKSLMLGKIEGWRRSGERVWDCWMASLTQWTWVWINSGSWWWTGRPGVLQSMGSQRVERDWTTELNRTTFSESFLSNSQLGVKSRKANEKAVP